MSDRDGFAAAATAVAAPPRGREATSLSPAARHAVAVALGTLDLALLRGPADADLAAALCLEAARTGERVLVTAADPALLDAVLTRLAESPEVLPVRRLAPDESVDDLPATSRHLLAAAQLHRIRTRPVERAAAEWAAARDRHAAAADRCDRLTALARLVADRDAAERTLAEAPAYVNGYDAEPLRRRLATLDGEADSTRAALAAIESRLQLRASKQFWTAAWWRERFAGSPPDAGRDGLVATLDTHERDRATVCADLDACEAAGRRSAEVAASRSTLEAAHATARHRCRTHADGLPLPLDPPADAVATCLAEAVVDRDRCRAALDQAEQWRATLPGLLDAWAERWADEVNVTAAPHAAEPPPGVTLHVRLDATGYAPAAPLPGRRWVVFGEADHPGFAREWDRLAAPAWAHAADGRLIARLAASPAEHVVREPLADDPAVELAIHAPPAAAATLIEVTFPADTPVAVAKRRLAADLGDPGFDLPPCRTADVARRPSEPEA